MSARPLSETIATDEIPDLDIPLEKVCWVIAKARQFDVKDVPSELEAGSNASDDRMIGVLEQSPDDPVEQELRSFISALTQDEQFDLVALCWLGRNNSTIADWSALREEAARAGASHPHHAASYLMGEPLLSDNLGEALSMFAASCSDFEG